MKKSIFPVALTLLLISGYCSHAQYGKEPDAGINSKTNPGNYYNPTAQTIFTVDSSVINHIDFGQKKNKGSFKTIFDFQPVADSKSVFSFKKSQITGTNMTKNSGIIGIELTTKGFEILYSAKNKLGPIDDYVAIHTENGDIILRLTGEIIDSKKKENN
jgi:hypothetical protein